MKDRTRAYHEAGHAVVARVLGVPITHITLFSTDPNNRAIVQTRSAWWLARNAEKSVQVQAAKNNAKVALAGPYAQIKHRPQTNVRRAQRDDWGGDMMNAQAAIALAVLLQNDRPLPDGDMDLDPQLRAEGVSLFACVSAEANTLVSDNWRAIERTAEALLRHRILIQADIDAIIAED